MKTIFKLIFYSTLIMIIATIGVSYWYISDHLLSNISDIQTTSVKDIIIEIGLIGALIPTFLFISIYLLKINVKKVWLFSFLTSIIIVFTIIALYRFILFMTFHQFTPPIQFNLNI